MDPPVPIPNTEVKLRSADDTASARVWENRSLPGDYVLKSPLRNGLFIYVAFKAFARMVWSKMYYR